MLINDCIDLKSIIDKLKNDCPIFHGEKDFQFELAWKIKQQNSKAKIRMEKPVRGRQK